MDLKKADSVFLTIAKEIASLSNCVSLHVGALIVRDGRMISSGYNGSPSGYKNCDCHFSEYDKSSQRELHHSWSNHFEIHAEMNALLYAAKHGISTENSTMFCTHCPCHQCLKNIINAGIKRIVYLEQYDKSDYVEGTYEMLSICGVILEKFNT